MPTSYACFPLPRLRQLYNGVCYTGTISMLLASAAAAQTPEVTFLQGPVPPPLVVEAPRTTAPGLVRWLGEPTKRSMDVKQLEWMPDGTKLFADRGSRSSLNIWQHTPGASELRLTGVTYDVTGWALSPDGTRLFTTDETARQVRMHKTADLGGLWALEAQGVQWQGFTDGGASLVMGTAHVPGTAHFSRIDAATGELLAQTKIQFGSNVRREGVVAYGTDQVLFAPECDSQQRVTRLTTAKWEPEAVTAPLEGWGRARITLGKSGKWMVLWDDGRYAVFQWNGTLYEKKFEGEFNHDPASRDSIWSLNPDGSRRGFNSITLSPDESTLILSGRGRHKVIRTADRKVVHESDAECLCGTFHPTGRQFWDTCSPFTAVDTQRWEAQPNVSPGHRNRVSHIAFSPDGKRLASSSSTAIHVWRTDTGTIESTLISPEPCGLTEFAWLADGKTLIGGDVTQHLKWQVPPPAPQSRTPAPPVIKGTVLFKRELEAEDSRLYAAIRRVQPDPRKSRILFSTGLSAGFTDIRDPSRPNVARKFKLGPDDPYPVKTCFFSSVRDELLYHNEDTFYAYDLEKDTLRKSANKVKGSIMGYSPPKNRLAVHDTGRITIVDGETFATVREILPIFTPNWGFVSAYSSDGRWVVTTMPAATPRREPKLCLIDAEKGEPVFASDSLPYDPTCIEFTPDGHGLAVTFPDGSISLWSTAAMAASGVPAGLERRNTLAQNPNARRGATTHVPTEAGAPPPPLTLRSGETLLTEPDGTISCEAAGLELGRWLFNGRPMEVFNNRSTLLKFPTGDMVTCFADMDGVIPGLYMRRAFSLRQYGEIHWKDTLVNQTPTPIVVSATFISRLGGGQADLLAVGAGLPTPVAQGGPDTLSSAHVIGSSTRLDRGQRFVVANLSTPSAPQRARHRWDEARQAVVSEWRLKLEPFQRLVFGHVVTIRQVEASQPFARALSMSSHAHVLLSAFRMETPLLANATVEPETQEAYKKMIPPGKIYGPDGSVLDAFGLKWRHVGFPFEGISSEMGAAQILAPWVNGSTIGMIEKTELEPGSKAPQRMFSEARDRAGSTGIRRRINWSPEKGAYVVHDTVTNKSDKAMQTQVKLAVIASDQIASVIKADGTRLDLNSAVDGGATGGKIGVIFPGTSKPAVIVAFGSPGAALPSKLVLEAGRGLFMCYEVSLEPGQSIALAHMATARPLEAYESVPAAFQDFATDGYLQEFADYGYPPPANWTFQAKAPAANP